MLHKCRLELHLIPNQAAGSASKAIIDSELEHQIK